MPNVSDFYLDHTTGRAYFEMDDGTNIFKDLSTIQDSQTGAETAFMSALIANGFVNSLSVDNSAAFQAAINAAANAGQYTVTIPSWIRVINLANEITIDICKTSLNLNGCYLTFKNLGASKYGIKLTNSVSLLTTHRRMFCPIYNGSIGRRLDNGTVLRDDSYNNSISGILLDSTDPNLPVAGISFQNLYIEGFRDGVYIGRSSYILSFFNVQWDRNYTGVGSRNVTAGTFENQGERIAFTQCLFSTNYEHFHVEGMYLFMQNCSIDYPSVPSTDIPLIANRKQRIGTVAKGSKVQLNNCHIEFRDNSTTSNDTALIYVQDSNSSFIMRDGAIVCGLGKWDGSVLSNGPDGYIAYDNLQNFIEVGGTGVGRVEMTGMTTWGTAAFRSRKWMRLRDGSSNSPSVAKISFDCDPSSSFTGGKSLIPCLGDASVTGGRGFGNLLYPTFAAAVGEDGWSIHGTGNGALTGQTNRTTATSFTATTASNTLSFNKLTGTGAGTVGRLRLIVPAEVGKSIALNFTASATSASSAIKFSIGYATLPEIVNNYLPNPKVVKQVCNGAGADNMTVSTSDTEYNLHSFSSQSSSWDGGDRICPAYATHALITFDLTSIDATASTFSLNLKKFSVSFV